MDRIITFGRSLEPRAAISTAADWQQSDPRWIDRALKLALARPGGGWFVADARRRLGQRPRLFRIAGREIVIWGSPAGLHAAPNACPHLGASLAEGCVRGDAIVCPWHGLALGPGGHGNWRPLPLYDDGILVWVRLDDVGETPRPVPALPERPARPIDAVIRMEARCEPEDVIANRLDPWHGAHFHPHSFRRLKVLEQKEDEITVRVAFRVLGPLAVEVDARFHCPDPRTIVMTIVAGDGQGSVVETHATPIGDGRAAVIEATLVHSDRAGFPAVRRLAGLVRPLIERAAARLWVEDVAYAERRRAILSEPRPEPSSTRRIAR